MKLISNKRPIRQAQGEQAIRDKRQETRDWKRGQSLIEVLIAFAVVTLVGMAIISATLATQRTSISARSKSQATELVQQYLEQVRVIRDIGGFSLFVNATCYVIQGSHQTDPSQWSLSSTSALPSPQSGGCTGTSPYIGEIVNANNINYYRKITVSDLTPVSTVSKKVVVVIAWKEGTNDRSVSNETIISKWCGGKVDTGGAACPP